MPYIELRDQKQGLVMIEASRKSMRGNTPEQIKGAQLARVVQGRVGHPPDGVLKKMVRENIPKNIPIGLNNVADALAIYGPPVSMLKGAKTREKTHPRVGEGGKIEIPRYFLSIQQICDLDGGCNVRGQYPIPSHFLKKYQNDYRRIVTQSHRLEAS